MNWLSTTCINSGEQLQEYINTFKLNVVQAKYNELKDAATLISYFSATLPTWIMHRVQAMDTVPTTLTVWYEKAAHIHLQKEITRKIALTHQGNGPQSPRTNQNFQPTNPRPPCDPNAMDIDSLNLTPTEQSCCLCEQLCFICKKANCSTSNHPRTNTTTHQGPNPTRPVCNPERIQTALTAEEGDLLKYIKELEGKGKKPDELLCLLQLAVDADENEGESF